MIDLHLHSNVSDGLLSPAQLIEKGTDGSGSLLALTDHDTLQGVEEFRTCGEARNIATVTGVELSVDFPHGELHLLGYGFDPVILEESGLLEEIRTVRENRNRRIFELMESSGLQADYGEWTASLNTPVPGRPHIADYLIRKGIVKSRREAFVRYLSEGRPFFLPRNNPPLERCVNTILAAGGLPVVAHPYSLRISRGALIDLLPHWKEIGIAGIETVHPSVNREQSHRLTGLAEQHGLLCSGGSDFHGTPEDRRFFGKTSWGTRIPESLSIIARLTGR